MKALQALNEKRGILSGVDRKEARKVIDQMLDAMDVDERDFYSVPKGMKEAFYYKGITVWLVALDKTAWRVEGYSSGSRSEVEIQIPISMSLSRDTMFDQVQEVTYHELSHQLDPRRGFRTKPVDEFKPDLTQEEFVEYINSEQEMVARLNAAYQEILDIPNNKSQFDMFMKMRKAGLVKPKPLLNLFSASWTHTYQFVNPKNRKRFMKVAAKAYEDLLDSLKEKKQKTVNQKTIERLIKKHKAVKVDKTEVYSHTRYYIEFPYDHGKRIYKTLKKWEDDWVLRYVDIQESPETKQAWVEFDLESEEG